MCRCTGYRPIIEAFESFSSCDNNEVPLNLIPDEILKSMREVTSCAVTINQNNNKIFAKTTTVKETLDMMKKHPNYFLRQGGTGTYKKFEKFEDDAIKCEVII